ARSGVPGYAAPHRAPRRDGQALTLVADPHHFDGFGAGRRAQFDRVAFARLQKRAGDRRHPAHPAAIRVGLVDADDGDGARLAAPVLICDGGAEKHAAAILLLRRVHHLGDFEPLGQEADAAVDLAQTLFAIDIVAVLRAVAVARRPGHGLDHARPLDPRQRVELGLERFESGARDVVARARG